MRRTLLLAATALLLAGCSSSAPTVNTQPVKVPAAANTSTTSAPSKAASTSAAPKAAKVGDTIDLSGGDEHIQITLVKLVDPAKSTDEYRTPKPGNRFIAVQMRIVNVNSKAYTGDPMARTVAKDADGQVFEADFSPAQTDVGQPMDSGLTLAPGDKALGVLTFEVPVGVKLVMVQYSTHAFNNGKTAQWAVG